MTKTLVIAEKPSVAQDIVRALTPVAGKFEKHEDHFENDRYVVTSAVGHLVEIQAPEQFDVKRGKWSFAHLPVIPPYFDLKPVDKTKSRLNAVVKQAKRKDVTELINACDAGREGELIFRLIEQYAGGSKPLGKPVKRLWLQSMTPQAIRDGFDALRSEQQMAGLASAARSRSEADWLVGINGTRAMTAFNSRDGGFFLTTVGRVQTPTLSLVVEREEKIRKFISRDYWEIHATFGAQAGEYPAKWFDPKWKKGSTGEGPGATGPDVEARADRVWSAAEAQAIANAVRGKQATVTEESKPTTQASPLLFDLTSLQREANGKFGFSAKTTLALAQSLYERHKALTYPRTDSRALPEDYLPVAKQTFEMLADSGMRHLAPHALTALNNNYIRPSKRIFDNSKVSDHFAIIPTTQAPSGLSEAEQKLYDLVVRRFMAVFFPSAEYTVTTRISTVTPHSFKTEGKVLVKPGWLAIYGKEAADEVEGGKDGDKGQNLVPVKPGEMVNTLQVDPKGLKTKPPARYSEATLLGAMESAGKQIDDDELREAMQEKGLGTPATRAAIIEGLLTEKYMLREGREIIPTAKAFQLMTLLRGLEVEELCRAELTGEWEYKLSQMEKGQLSREAFMQEIAAMTERMVKKAKEYDRDTIPGDYATLESPCPNCGGVVKENYRRYACVGKPGAEGCGFSFGKSPAGRTFETAEAEQLLRDKKIGPLEGFRSKAGWPFTSEIVIKYDDEAHNYKLEFDFGDDKNAEESGELVEFEDASLGACPICGSEVHEHGSNYVCSKAVPTAAQPTPSCTFKSGKIILQQPVEREQMHKLLETGKTDLLDKFVSMRTRRNFKAHLAWDKEAGKVNFEFAPSKFPPRPGAAAKTAAAKAGKTTAAAKKAPAKKAAAKSTAAKAPRKAAAGKAPSAALAAVIGNEPVARPEAVKKMWEYIKAHNLQDPKDKRTIVADDKLRAVFGKDSAGMFELAGILGNHLGGE
ncbi:DNA topoisomerase-3 [Acidovorax delafieldii]|uniref:DNA topoisomerase n=1 Tax=Acidovorax delafieldii TaxID=47920 RepID=A0AAJ2EZ89_ACIDE|nr:DNA topoisomerase III [Acidovorax delafieldii]MDR6764957.1 DNA topoisomerase-3 [Acidovorax delafieldii]MDR6835394.1 DNA topoisomerase-3 [Acidovorax delafieldii]MDR7365636.1 DNA topoisomerase-3 [Acidovorax delafieldii]